VLGDSRYSPAKGKTHQYRRADDSGGDLDFVGDGSTIFGPEPSAIGLQCCELAFDLNLFPSICEDLSSNAPFVNGLKITSSNKIMNNSIVITKTTITADKPFWRI
jgi:hypothetical protein